jgi:hypothetical protein
MKLEVNSPFDRWGLALAKKGADDDMFLSDHDTAAEEQYTKPILSYSVLRALLDMQEIVVVMGLKKHAGAWDSTNCRYVITHSTCHTTESLVVLETCNSVNCGRSPLTMCVILLCDWLYQRYCY